MASSAMQQLAFDIHQNGFHHPSASSTALPLPDGHAHAHAVKTSLLQMPTHYPVGNMPPAQAARQFANTAARLADAAKSDAAIIKSLLMQAQMHLAKLLQIKSQTDAAAEGSQLASKAAVAKNMGFSTAAVGVTSGSEYNRMCLMNPILSVLWHYKLSNPGKPARQSSAPVPSYSIPTILF